MVGIRHGDGPGTKPMAIATQSVISTNYPWLLAGTEEGMHAAPGGRFTAQAAMNDVPVRDGSPDAGAVLDSAFPALPEVRSPGYASVMVTGMIGAGKSTVLPAIKEELERNYPVDVVIVKEGADEEPFASALKYRYTGVTAPSGTVLHLTSAEFQGLVTTQRTTKYREALEAARLAHAASLRPVIILVERGRQDAGEVFIPAGRLLEEPERHELYDLSMKSWYGTTLLHGEHVPDAVFMLSAPFAEVIRRQEARARPGEKGYKTTVLFGTDKPYLQEVWERYEAMGSERKWRTLIDGAQWVVDSHRAVRDVARTIVDHIVATVLPTIEIAES